MQDIATLSRDVEHANKALSPIFNKEKEQKRLKQAQRRTVWAQCD
nr:hypothetical protein [Pectobacterium brasiliense]